MTHVIDDIIAKAMDGTQLTRDELVALLEVSPASPAAYRIMAAAALLSRDLSGSQAEVHAQFALNLARCGRNCKFCSFASINGVFDQDTEISLQEAVDAAVQFEKDGANAIFVMTTANYPYARFLEYSQEIRAHLSPATVMVANVGDRTAAQAGQLREAGYQGVYHALRLREGTDTGIDPQTRRDSINAFKEAGLSVGTCVEPVGPEHTSEEIADAILFTGSFDPAYSGAARRIPIPGTELAEYGMISELRMAHIVAVTRLGVPRSVVGNCTHEPCTLGAMGGANLFWAEVGANPRDTSEHTEESRGHTAAYCAALFSEADWDTLQGPSVYYTGVKAKAAATA